ncbi:hypothetical protein LTR37_011086 [Vermiconidia calcicola]|uniref:Uncharacterized protein n=1 Tax=Vermiconidia calcicola TaxID=1690605 RepID=A0ACC3N342_9PEZI|nr:hypothetical protein LTR37_011086 [Vermiconidia calcicola]
MLTLQYPVLDLKCVIKSGEKSCTRCGESNRKCTFDPKFRFRQVSYVDTSSSGSRSRTDLSYDQDQPWVSTLNPLNFVLEDGTGLEYGTTDIDGMDALDDYALPLNNDLFDELDRTDAIERITGVVNRDTLRDEDAAGPSLELEASRDQVWQRAPVQPVEVQAASLGVDLSSPASIEELTKRQRTGLPIPAGPSSPKLSRREAFLLHHFTEKLAPWLDACDLSCHFALEVPKRAIQKPMVLYSLLALSSRHCAILNIQEEHEASFYHGHCLRLVIDALSAAERSYDDTLLTAVVLLRSYEEIEQSTDRYLHLQGMGRLVAAIPTFAHSGGLAEAACWLSLRQDIFVSLINSQPPTLYLENYDQSSAFRFRDDGACANVIILIFAKILRLANSSEASYHDEQWADLESDVGKWNDRRVHLFQPIYDEEADVDSGRPFPVICMINAPQVVAVQYYYASKIFILLHKPANEAGSGFNAAKRRRNTERLVASYLAAIIGLATSNEMVQNANFTAHHILRSYGYYITNPIQRSHVVHFLEHVHRLMAWNTTNTIALLQSQWSDLDNPND